MKLLSTEILEWRINSQNSDPLAGYTWTQGAGDSIWKDWECLSSGLEYKSRIVQDNFLLYFWSEKCIYQI